MMTVVESTRPWTIVAADSSFLQSAGSPPETIAFLESILSCPRQRELLATGPVVVRISIERIRSARINCVAIFAPLRIGSGSLSGVRAIAAAAVLAGCAVGIL